MRTRKVVSRMCDRHNACRGCYWFDQCGENRPCDYYYPVSDEYAEYKEELSEAQRRREFYDEYIEYISDWT